MSGLINPLFDGFTYYMCGRFHFPFSTLTSSSSKHFFKCTTFKFWKFITVHILEVKGSGTCHIENDFHKSQIVTHYCY